MWIAVDVHGRLCVTIEEVGASAVQDRLRLIGESESFFVQVRDEVLFQGAFASCQQCGDLVAAREAPCASASLDRGQFQQVRQSPEAVQQAVFALIALGQQAVIAGSLAPFGATLGAPQI